MRSIGARASGMTGDDSTLTAFADAVAKFQPDHILIALRSSDHAYWSAIRSTPCARSWTGEASDWRTCPYLPAYRELAEPSVTRANAQPV